MRESRKRILFVSHEASRTGAPILLLNLIKWINAYHRNTFDIRLLSIYGGNLLPEFSKEVKTYVWNLRISKVLLFIGFVLRKLHLYKWTYNHQRIVYALSKFRPDLVYYNTTATSPIVQIFHNEIPKARAIMHVHELNAIIKQHDKDGQFTNAIPYIDKLIAVSNIVKENLITNHHVNPRMIEVIHEYINVEEWEGIDEQRSPLSDKFIVGGAGFAHWRKGPEFFILLALELKNMGLMDLFRFDWIGEVNFNDRIYLEEDLRKLGLFDSVKFVGSTDDMSGFYKSIDVLVICSREDPYPVVALEAALYKVPILTWDQGVGTVELIEQGAGLIAKYFDVRSMAKHIVQLKENIALRESLGAKAQQLAKMHDVNIIGQKILKAIEVA